MLAKSDFSNVGCGLAFGLAVCRTVEGDDSHTATSGAVAGEGDVGDGDMLLDRFGETELSLIGSD